MDTTETLSSPGIPSVDRIELDDPTRVSGAVQSIDFHALSRSVQERFVLCIRGRQAPMPIVVSKIRSKAPALWSFVIAAAFVAIVAWVVSGHGDLRSDRALHPSRTLPIYFVCVATIAL